MAVFSVGLAGSLYTLVQYGLVSLRWCCVVVLFCCFCCFVGPSVGAGWSSGLMRESDLRGLALERWSRLISTMSRGRGCLEVRRGNCAQTVVTRQKCDCSISTAVHPCQTFSEKDFSLTEGGESLFPIFLRLSKNRIVLLPCHFLFAARFRLFWNDSGVGFDV
jgi:hypothetical protein